MNTLKQFLETNENFRAMVKAAPNLRFDEGQALEKWFLKCVREWLEQNREDNLETWGKCEIAQTQDWIFSQLLGRLDPPVCNNSVTKP
jgi:hypothetical protein